jgi:hypothetical protein
MPATAVVQIIGIFLISYQIVPGALVAVAPRISCPSSQASQLTRTGDIVSLRTEAERAMFDKGIVEHGALLLMQPCDFISSSGWTPAPALLESNGQVYLYVKLNGEHIRFNTNMAANASLRGSRSKITASPTIEGPVIDNDDPLDLPHVLPGGKCCVHSALRKEYLPPNYELAAAVLDFSSAQASACTTTLKRKDTIVNIANSGTLTIEATNGTVKKSITVQGGAGLIFANVPVDATGAPACNSGALGHHGEAYDAMVLPCDKAGRCTVWIPSHTACAKQPVLVMPFSPGPSDPTARVSAECSNNQWP